MMRKRTIKYISDKLLWLIVMLLPIFWTFIVNLHYTESGAVLAFSEVFQDSSYGFGLAGGNIIYDSLISLFGSEGVLPLLADDSIIFPYISYLVIVVLVQLAYDVITFIPKLAHKYMHKFTQDEE